MVNRSSQREDHDDLREKHRLPRRGEICRRVEDQPVDTSRKVTRSKLTHTTGAVSAPLRQQRSTVGS